MYFPIAVPCAAVVGLQLCGGPWLYVLRAVPRLTACAAVYGVMPQRAYDVVPEHKSKDCAAGYFF